MTNDDMTEAVERLADSMVGTTRAFRDFDTAVRDAVAEQSDRLSPSQCSLYHELRRHGEPILEALRIVTRKR